MSKVVCWSSRAMPVLPDELKGIWASRCAAAAGRLPTLAAMHSVRFNHHFLSLETRICRSGCAGSADCAAVRSHGLATAVEAIGRLNERPSRPLNTGEASKNEYSCRVLFITV